MQRRSLDSLLGQLEQLSPGQRDDVRHAMHAIGCKEQVVATIETARADRLCCPRCHCLERHRHGRANGLQRYRCRVCGHTYHALSGTPLARLRHKAKWLDYCDGMLDPAATVRRSAERVGVHKNTRFRWRHRMLTWIRTDRQLPLRGIVEADEMYLLRSEKGARHLARPARKRGCVATQRGISREQVCIGVARDRSGSTFDAVPGMGPATTAQLHRHLAPVLHRDALLVTDSHAASRAFARATGIKHQSVNLSAGERVRGDMHTQNVNGCHSRLRGWRWTAPA